MAGIGINTSLTGAVSNTTTTSSNSSLDKEAFLQLLATEMKYQDPLEPTSNTEYMSQLAQFSTVEQLQNMNSTFASNQALNLAGKYVILNVPDSAGNITQVSGLVDYVTVSDGKAYFSINDQYYDADYLDSVVSLDYLEYIVKNSTTDSTTTESEQTTDGSDNSDTNESQDSSDTEGTEEA